MTYSTCLILQGNPFFQSVTDKLVPYCWHGGNSDIENDRLNLYASNNQCDRRTVGW